jgi:hypothetical protein
VTGNIGINITAPTGKFHVVGSAPASVATATGTAAANCITAVGGTGGDTSYSGGVATAGAGGTFSFTGGTGGSTTGAPGTGSGGAGGNVDFYGGNGGTGTTFGGVGGYASLQGGSGGFGVTGGGAPGYAALKGGNAFPAGNMDGANVYCVGGFANGTGVAGNVILGVSPSLTKRGFVGIGTGSPNFLLHVDGSSLNTIARFTNNGTGDYIAAGESTSTLFRVLHSGGIISAGLTYPTSDGTANQVLKTNGSGVLSFTDMTEGFWYRVSSGGVTKGISMNIDGDLDGHVSIGILAPAYPDSGLIVASKSDAFSGIFYGAKGVVCDKISVGNGSSPYTASNILYSFPTTAPSVNGQIMSFNTDGSSSWVTVGSFASKWTADTYGIHQTANTNIGVGADSINGAKIYGYTVAASCNGVEGYSQQAVGVQGTSVSNYSGYFNGGLGTYTNKLTIGAMVFPTADGTANYVLKTDGSGVLSWTAMTASQWTTYISGVEIGISYQKDVSIGTTTVGATRLSVDGGSHAQTTEFYNANAGGWACVGVAGHATGYAGYFTGGLGVYTSALDCIGALKQNGNTRIDANGYFVPKTSTDAAAPNNSIYYSSTQSALVYKSSGGTVYILS